MTRAVWLDVSDRELREYLALFFRLVGWSVAASPHESALRLYGTPGRLVLHRGTDWAVVREPVTPERLIEACGRLLRARRAS